MKLPNISELLGTSDAGAISEWLVTQLAAQQCVIESPVFQARAAALIDIIAPALVWMRDHKGVPLTIEVLQSALELRTIWTLATQKVFSLRPDEAGTAAEIPVADMPESIVLPVRIYLGELPGFDPSLCYHEHKPGEPDRQHSYVLYYFSPVFREMLSLKSGQP